MVFEQLHGTTDIENGPNYQINVNSIGFAKSILKNNLDILTTSNFSNWFDNPWAIGIGTTVIASGIIGGITFAMRRFRHSD